MGIDEATIDRLAQGIHANYLVAYANGGPIWADLGEDLREANRAQARAIAGKLARVGAQIQPGAPATPPFTFTADEVELLAQAEHRRWVAQRRAAGWIYAAVRDNRRRRHPLIVKWAKLSEADQEKDRDAVRRIPDVLASVGLRAVRSARPR